eukprot:6490909-Amphidinium_carterae.1
MHVSHALAAGDDDEAGALQHVLRASLSYTLTSHNCAGGGTPTDTVQPPDLTDQGTYMKSLHCLHLLEVTALLAF